jgi:hypothetical protein
MKLKKIKTNEELHDAIYGSDRTGPFAEMVTVDGTLKSVRIGGLHIAPGQYGGIECCREVLFDEGTRYRLIAKVQGFPPQITYHERLGDIRDKQKSYGEGVETDDNNLTEVDVLLDDEGNVRREVYKGEEPPPSVFAEMKLPETAIPF